MEIKSSRCVLIAPFLSTLRCFLCSFFCNNNCTFLWHYNGFIYPQNLHKEFSLNNLWCLVTCVVRKLFQSLLMLNVEWKAPYANSTLLLLTSLAQQLFRESFDLKNFYFICGLSRTWQSVLFYFVLFLFVCCWCLYFLAVFRASGVERGVSLDMALNMGTKWEYRILFLSSAVIQ